MHSRGTTVTRPYDDIYRCLTCTGKRKLHQVLEKGRDLFLSISDQHFPSVVPPQDGNCIVTVRMSNMSLMDLGTHTVWQIVNDWAKHPRKYEVSADEHSVGAPPCCRWL